MVLRGRTKEQSIVLTLGEGFWPASTRSHAGQLIFESVRRTVGPRDAIRSYFCSGLDTLIIDNSVLVEAAIRDPYAAQAQAGIRVGLSA